MSGFMYLHLTTDERGGIHATVQPDGELKFRTLGTNTTRWTSAPFAVFQIESFGDLEHISDENLLEAAIQRFGREQLCKRLNTQLTPEELLNLLRERVVPRKFRPQQGLSENGEQK